jgi:hypothetical protein
MRFEITLLPLQPPLLKGLSDRLLLLLTHYENNYSGTQ